MGQGLLLAVLAAGMVAADRAGYGQEAQPDAGRRAEMLRRFDSDGDGQLSAEERTAARRARQERGGLERGGENRPAPAGGLRNDEQMQRLLDRFDRDDDGRLSYAEMAALREAMKARRETGPGGKSAEPPSPAGVEGVLPHANP